MFDMPLVVVLSQFVCDHSSACAALDTDSSRLLLWLIAIESAISNHIFTSLTRFQFPNLTLISCNIFLDIFHIIYEAIRCASLSNFEA